MSSAGSQSERLVDASPWGHWNTSTFVAGPRADGLIAPLVIGGATGGPTFRAYVEQVLVPELRKGDVVVMTTDRLTRLPASARQSERQVPAFLTCRTTALT